MIICNDVDLRKAFQSRETTIHIKNERIGNSFLLAGKIQEGHLPIIPKIRKQSQWQSQLQ